ncbi:hypothetical protein BS47DRAFT_1292973 [Hydnum rufescens UP504]|uniref:Uncharacterized protein n=1 Tax=Hydnum rufescens UP504 TaxID=1448309 RepID=A0A9P6B1Q9_9AGAM|nr:hypothetical protein BS47DRAFT_1292973 [Hydnum rufescens UP504]
MVPQQFSIRYQHGITGGFAPPTPNLIHILSRTIDAPDKVMVMSQTRLDGTPSLSPAKTKSLDVTTERTEGMVNELQKILEELPFEIPTGSTPDVYGMDQSIMLIVDNNVVWANAGPQGCSPGPSGIQPTAEHQKRFREAVVIIEKLVTQSQ